MGEPEGMSSDGGEVHRKMNLQEVALIIEILARIVEAIRALKRLMRKPQAKVRSHRPKAN